MTLYLAHNAAYKLFSKRPESLQLVLPLVLGFISCLYTPLVGAIDFPLD